MWSAEVIMKIKIVCVGRLKEKYLVAGIFKEIAGLLQSRSL